MLKLGEIMLCFHYYVKDLRILGLLDSVRIIASFLLRAVFSGSASWSVAAGSEMGPCALD